MRLFFFSFVLAIASLCSASNLTAPQSSSQRDIKAELEELMEIMEWCYNSCGSDDYNIESSEKLISRFGTPRLKSTYDKTCKSISEEMELYLLRADGTDGYMTIKKTKILSYTSDTAKLYFTAYYRGPEGPEDISVDGDITFFVVYSDGKWLIEDIIEDGHNETFLSAPRSYAHFCP